MKTSCSQMKCWRLSLLLGVLLPALASAQLAVKVLPPKVVGQKVVVQLKMKNNLADKIATARAVCFLLDDQGNVIGQSTKWVISKTGLEPKDEATFNFVMSSRQLLTSTNLTAKISFSRIILDSGQVADVKHEVIVGSTAK
jgi:hypothetical protein